MRELPIDPWNPLEYTPRSPDFDKPARPCDDFHHTLAWAFWVSGGLAGNSDKNAESSYEWVRHLRHLVLMGMMSKAMPTQVVVTPNYEYQVVSACEADKVGILITRTPRNKGEDVSEYPHFFREGIWDRAAILNAVNLNRDLCHVVPEQPPKPKPNIRRVSPFGPADTLMPPEIRPSMVQGVMAYSGIILPETEVAERPSGPATRTIRLIPEFSEGYANAVRRLDECMSIATVQILFDTYDWTSMTDAEFARFCIQDIPQRTQEFG